ncbi:MAG: glycosyltransferase family 4 protein [Clostridia bacterium]|nr:glycosyltransferase family 4 protein [Clostridia bacterium]
MSTPSLKNRLKQGLEQGLRHLAPLTHIVPEKVRHAARDRILQAAGISHGREPRRLPLPYQPGQDPDGINLFGFFKAENGLAQGVKCYARAIEESGIPHCFLNTDFLYWLPQNDTSWDSKLSTTADYAVNIVHINPDQWVEACNAFPLSAFDGRYTIGVWLWELETIPSQWADALKYVNELWAPSTFIAKALRKSVDVPVTVIPYGIETPCKESLTRADFGLPEDAFLVLAMFDSNSYASRKNPFGAIDAFWKAFGPEAEDARLVLKVNNPTRKDLKAIQTRAGGDSRVILVTETLRKPRLNRLISLCDVFVSLHRAEGFGLVMAEAMTLGVPVVATNWSSNTDFMTPDVSCLVDAELIPVGDAYQFGDGTHRWADPDLDQAADYLRRLHDDPEWRKEISKRGQAYIRDHNSVQRTGEMIRKRLEEILR